MQTETATELANAITEAETVLANSTESTLNAAIIRLTNAIAAVNASIAAYSALLADIEAATAYKAAHSDFDPTNFETAIAAAQAVYDTHTADVDGVTAAQADLAAAWKAFRYANTFDLTSKIVDAPVAVTNAPNWAGGGTNSNQQYTGAPDNIYLDYYNKNYDGYQTISGLPNGEYILKAAVRASATGVGSLYASSGGNEYLHPVIGIGADGNELGNGWYWAEIFDITVSDGTLKIGIKGSATSQRWIGADDFRLYYVGSTELIIGQDNTITAGEYLFGDIIFNEGSQLTEIGEDGLTVQGVVKYQLTVAKDRWYAIGFPFDIATVYSHYFAEQGWDAELYPKGSEDKTDDYWLRTYDGDQFTATAEAIEAGKGYIIQFPEWQDGQVISFISEPSVTLYPGATSLTADENYSLLNNPALQSLPLSTDDSNNYYRYNPTDNRFDLVEESEVSLNPFEAAIAIQKTSAPQNAPKQILIEDDFTTIKKPATSGGDPVIETRHYTLQGVAVHQSAENGVYIVKNIRQSGREEITKIVHLKK
jgi:hypothetical protein